MIATFTQYEHSPIGFPHIKLKWCEECPQVNGHRGRTGYRGSRVWSDPYVTIKGIIQPNPWRFKETQRTRTLNQKVECDLFDDWVRKNYADDPSMQG